MALEPETPVLPTKTEWTCPMHPEIVRDGPGSCPICGMALEPRTVTVEVDNPELRDMSRRFWISLVLTAPLVIGGMLMDMVPSWKYSIADMDYDLGRIRARDAGRALGWMAILRALLDVNQKPQREYVHADRAGRRRFLPI